MAFSSKSGGGAMADINVTPLVDVMLVLLIIFMVTAPMASYQIQVDLPQPSKNLEQPKDPPKPIRLRIDGNGQLFWDGSPLPTAALQPQLQIEATRDPQPTLELETNGETRYEVLADVLSTAKNAGMEKIGFVETM
ncbi:MAG: biopolymer transporter ExbD [Lysobacterales bacterium CG17_big_fil_post_rev_8_21_14_2_50_64_11]|nr:MAG: biopolymer transporter ExbD [Xanthomonadales bacterium CG17_big_fil_post_rev_8_21_14_2_50_64_11]PIX60698.1 MAG: biopolymer transporter ExbD [Xanthomonadales bacterium CG_4_10_14_3_um_filter_64_11]